jgi:hypothetical protein
MKGTHVYKSHYFGEWSNRILTCTLPLHGGNESAKGASVGTDGFCFNGYTVRSARHADLMLAEHWTRADPFHRNTTAPDFWIENKDGRESFLLLDALGPVFFFKTHILNRRTVQMHVQFMPADTEDNKTRLREGMLQGLVWMERVLKNAGVTRIEFDSQNPQLTVFAIKRLGFAQEGESLVKAL